MNASCRGDTNVDRDRVIRKSPTEKDDREVNGKREPKEAEKPEAVNGQKETSSRGCPRSKQIAHFPVSKTPRPSRSFPGGGSQELSVASLPHLPSSVSHDRTCRSVDDVHHVYLEGHLLVAVWQVRSVAQKVGVLPFHLPFASFE